MLGPCLGVAPSVYTKKEILLRKIRKCMKETSWFRGGELFAFSLHEIGHIIVEPPTCG